jgi:hypothetical protein
MAATSAEIWFLCIFFAPFCGFWFEFGLLRFIHSFDFNFELNARYDARARRSVDGPFRSFDKNHQEYKMTAMDERVPADSRESTCCH